MKKLEKNTVYSYTELTEMGYKFARFTGNRDFNTKALKDKEKSLKTQGLLQPAVVVPATMAVEEELEIVDFVTEMAIPQEELEHYLVPVDANHRLKAHFNLLNNDKNYHREFFCILPLAEVESIAQMIAEMNICTNVWKGGDFLKGAYMMHPELATDLLKYMVELERRKFSLPAISRWATFTDGINKKVLTDFMGGNVNAKLQNSNGIERSRRLLDAAKAFSTKFVGNRTFPDWIIGKYSEAKDEDKAKTVETLINFLSSVTKTEADEIEALKGTKGGTTKETLIFERLTMLYNKFLKQQEQAA